MTYKWLVYIFTVSFYTSYSLTGSAFDDIYVFASLASTHEFLFDQAHLQQDLVCCYGLSRLFPTLYRLCIPEAISYSHGRMSSWTHTSSPPGSLAVHLVLHNKPSACSCSYTGIPVPRIPMQC